MSIDSAFEVVADVRAEFSASEVKLFTAVHAVSAQLEKSVYVVGGYVRDMLLGRPNSDVDFVTLGAGIEFATAVAKELGVRKVAVFKNFGTAQFHYEDMEVEFVGARRESYRRNSRKPIVEDGTLEDDLLRRDFTINALAVSLTPGDEWRVIDLFDGQKDLAACKIVTPREPGITFDDDPLRMMRAIRFAAQLGFSMAPDVFDAICKYAERIQIVSCERIIDEFNKILLSPRPSEGLFLLEKTGLLAYFLPEVAALKGVENIEGIGHKDNFNHTLQVVDNAAEAGADLWLRWAALLHDIGKVPTKRFVPRHGWTFYTHEYVGAKMVVKIFRRLHLPQNELMQRVALLVRLHMRPIALTDDEVTDSAVRRLLFDAGDEIESLMLLCEADITSKNPNKVARFLHNFKRVREKLVDLEERDAIRNFQPPVTGERIMQVFGIAPCREIGVIKNAIKDAILDGLIANNTAEAEAFMLQKGSELGLKPVISVTPALDLGHNTPEGGDNSL